jgi:hypothetical protein
MSPRWGNERSVRFAALLLLAVLDDAVSGFRKEAAIYASLADIRDAVDAAAERYLKALG